MKSSRKRISKMLLLSLSLCFSQKVLWSQQFENPGLEGVVTIDPEPSVVPDMWQRVLASSPICNASDEGITDTPDLTGLIGPKPDIGVWGNPQSGISFVSGLSTIRTVPFGRWHEGIEQRVPGFTPDSSYTITFYQTVVKQVNAQDTSGSWYVYRDEYPLGLSAPSTSSLSYDDLNLQWEFRWVDFIATDTTHTFQFMPQDNDGNIFSGSEQNGALRMGIDSIYLWPTCHLEQEIGDTRTLCEEETAELSVFVANASYSWNTGALTPSIEAGPGLYRVTITGDNGCKAIQEVQVRRSNAFLLDLGPDTTLCAGAVIELDATTPGAQYRWQDGSIFSTLNVSESGIYWAEARVAGCTYRDSITINDNPVNNLSLGNDTILCNGENLILRPLMNLADAELSWSTGSQQSEITIENPGTYWLSATLNGCNRRDTLLVINAFEDFSLGGDTTLCSGESLLLDASMPNTSYLWQDGSTEAQYEALAGGTYTVQLSRNNCSLSDTITINELTLNSLDLGPDTLLCPGATLLLTPDLPGASFTWQDQSTSSTYLVTEPGLYWVTATFEQCSTNDTIRVIFQELTPPELPAQTTLCSGAEVVLDAFQPGATYAWSNGASTAAISIDSPGNYAVTVTVAGCTASGSTLIEPSPLQAFSLGPDTTLCTGEDLYLVAPVSADTYLWSDGSTTNTLSVSQAGTYWLSASLEACTEYDSIEISLQSLPMVNLGEDVTLCPGDSLRLQPGGSATATLLWSDGSTQNNLLVTNAGTYGVAVTDDGCLAADEIRVDYYPETTLSLGADTTVCRVDNYVILPRWTGPPPSFTWQNGSSAPSYPVQNTGTYTLLLQNACLDLSAEVIVTVEDCSCQVFTPNAFSPNQDGINDEWKIYTPCPITDFELQIFDRWGGLIHQSQQLDEGWLGDGPQGIINSGVYLFALRYRDRFGQWQQRAGEVHLIR